MSDLAALIGPSLHYNPCPSANVEAIFDGEWSHHITLRLWDSLTDCFLFVSPVNMSQQSLTLLQAGDQFLWWFFKSIKVFRFLSEHSVVRNTQTNNPNQPQQMPWVVMVTMVFQWTVRSRSTGKCLLHQWHFFTRPSDSDISSSFGSNKLLSVFHISFCGLAFSSVEYIDSSFGVVYVDCTGMACPSVLFFSRWKLWVYPLTLSGQQVWWSIRVSLGSGPISANQTKRMRVCIDAPALLVWMVYSTV